MTDEKIARIEHRLAVDKADGCHFAQTEAIDDVLAIIERMRAAEAIVAKLPVTADGVPMTPGRVFLTQDIYRTVQAQFDIRDLGDNWYHYHQVYSTEAAARAASASSPGAQGGTTERARVESAYSSSGIPDPERPGRVLNPFDATENPTFLPGDKVRDKRDCTRKIWRIIARQAYLDSEYITLRDVDDDANERRLVAKTLIPYLEMVAMMQRHSAASPLDAGAQGGTEGAGKP